MKDAFTQTIVTLLLLVYLKNNSTNAHEEKRNAVTKVIVLTLLAYLKDTLVTLIKKEEMLLLEDLLPTVLAHFKTICMYEHS
jgi:hypothetical protein